MKRLLLSISTGLLLFGFSIAIIGARGTTSMGQLGQAPEPGQNASFLQTNTALKIIKIGTTSVTLPNPATLGEPITVQVAHNLHFAPYHTATVEDSFGNIFSVPHQWASPTPGVGALPLDLDVDVSATRTVIQFQLTPITHLYDGTTFNFRYYIYDNVVEP